MPDFNSLSNLSKEQRDRLHDVMIGEGEGTLRISVNGELIVPISNTLDLIGTGLSAESVDGRTVITSSIGDEVLNTVTESFAATNERFFGDLGLPQDQSTVWTDLAGGDATIDIQTDTVFGVSKQVVRYNDDVTNGSCSSRAILTFQNWVDIDAFGASFGGISRCDTITGAGGFFSRIGASASTNPANPGTAGRLAFLAQDDGSGDLKLTSLNGVFQGSVTMDGTGGNPQIDFDQYFIWECILPAGLGPALFYINDILTTFAPTYGDEAGAINSLVVIGSGNVVLGDRISYHSDFGFTVYEDSGSITLAAATMAAGIAQVITPPGRDRNYTITLPDGNPRPVGNKLEILAGNPGGAITLAAENLADPESLFQGLSQIVLDIPPAVLGYATLVPTSNTTVATIIGTNLVNDANFYTGFDALETKFFSVTGTTDDSVGTSETDMDEMSIDVISNGSPIKLNCWVGYSNNIIDAFTTFRLKRDGATIRQWSKEVNVGSQSVTTSVDWIDTPVAGTYTYKVTWQADNGTSACDAATNNNEGRILSATLTG